MYIQDARCFIIGNPPPHFGGRYFIFVKLITACGITGLGEIYSPPFHPSAVKPMVEDVLERLVIGRDPFKIEDIWRLVYARGYNSRPDSSLVSILSGIETALWDIAGKACGRPVHDLLGGAVRERLRAYTYIYPDKEDAKTAQVYADPDMAAERALSYVNAGFTAVKFDPAGPYTRFDPRQLSLEDLERSHLFVSRLREAVGTRADLLFGTHGQMTPAGAIRLAKKLEAADPLWFEEPVPPEKPEEMALVARSTSIPVATGERLVTKYEFARVLECRAAAILQPALGRAGGMLEVKKIAGMAEAFYAQIAPHLYCGPVEWAANVHVAATLPNFLILETIDDWSGFHKKLLKKSIKLEAGYALVPTEPGLGIELDEEVALAHPYSDSPLHLEPHPPVL